MNEVEVVKTSKQRVVVKALVNSIYSDKREVVLIEQKKRTIGLNNGAMVIIEKQLADDVWLFQSASPKILRGYSMHNTGMAGTGKKAL